MDHTEAQEVLREIASTEIAVHSQRFFKTGPGNMAREINSWAFGFPTFNSRSGKQKNSCTPNFMKNDFALIILVSKTKKARSDVKKNIFELYLSNTEYVNNWDLVDTSAEDIVGVYLSDKDRAVLYRLAKSDNLWERRIAIMSTFHFIKKDDFKDTLAIAELLLQDEHDLIHKAVGWMLREVGN